MFLGFVLYVVRLCVSVYDRIIGEDSNECYFNYGFEHRGDSSSSVLICIFRYILVSM